ncbi:MAG TPA: hydantoinase/oxoprolinase family protein [Tepidisphaeraceae bacterium]|jgi:N-methylhydantoinase A|nr:hydantoinase/oxoprolinase family protein [Tepidisphaeraceae bacterium]
MSTLHSEQTSLRIGVDVGGTFTDLIATDGVTLHVVKIPSTPPDFHRAVIEAVALAGAFGTAAHLIHGSTVATNALLQRAGAPVAFITTEGFRDMLLIGRQNRPSLYALNIVRPKPLTDVQNWFTVRERISAFGEVVEPLAEAEVDRLIRDIQSRGLHHAAVCLLFSFINPAHEQQIARKCAAAGISVSLSSEILPEFREYERASTTVINAAMRPVVKEYLEALSEGLAGEGRGDSETRGRGTGDGGGDGRGDTGTRRRGKGDGGEGRGDTETRGRREGETDDADSAIVEETAGSQASLSASPRPGVPASLSPPSLQILHSSGGTLSPHEAAQNAARLVLSGPAGGVMGAAFAAMHAGFRDVITYDMGGTSTDVAVILDGRPQWTTSAAIDGLPIALPMFDIHTVGAGGGSVAYLDAGGALRVGARSAGAIPGPACYNRGGIEPTVTDANLVLGRIVPGHFLGGKMSIELSLAHSAIANLAAAMSKSVIDTALGIVKVAEANMEHAIRAVTSRRGHDPRQFALVSFGGAGGLHACALAESLDIPRVLIPPYCGVLSALGMLVAPPVADASRTVVHLGAILDDERLVAEFGSLSGQTIDVIPYEQTDRVEVFADVRFRGQSHEIKVKIDRPNLSHIAERFTAAYRALYGGVPQGRAIEVVTLRVRRYGHAPPLRLPAIVAMEARENIACDVVGDDGSTWRARLIARNELPVSAAMPGPLLLIDPEATTLIPPAWRATMSENGSVTLERTI